MLDDGSDPAKRAEIAKQIKETNDGFDQEIKQLIGDDNFSTFQSYEKTSPDRMTLSMFRDQFPDVVVSEQLFVHDRERITCAGGSAALDLMLHLIERRHGSGLAQIVANAFIAQRVRSETEPQRLSATNISGDRNSPLSRILQEVEQNLEAPVSAKDLAAKAKISVRAMGRILRDRVGESPMRYYLKMRLQAARNALFYSDVPIHDVAALYGFSCPEVFSRSFKSHFGVTPRAFRQQFTRERLRRFRPELEQQIGFAASPAPLEPNHQVQVVDRPVRPG